jgi:hypothetical protein
MARILITDDTTAREATESVIVVTRQVIAEVVTLSEPDGIYMIRCTGDGGDECPGDIEPGDTWSSFEDCVQEAIRHIGNHELRRL